MNIKFVYIYRTLFDFDWKFFVLRCDCEINIKLIERLLLKLIIIIHCTKHMGINFEMKAIWELYRNVILSIYMFYFLII